VTSAWAPLRHPLYRMLWIAQLVSNVGTWMQTVGAQWLMGTLGGSALQIALVQAAIMLPVLLVAMPAGALGDIVDRRRLLIVSQALMLAVSGALAIVTFADAISPWLLLALIFSLGLAQALTMPSWQAIVPELVERREITLASALAGVNMNVSRAVGPALGGVLVAVAGPEWTFALNAVSFVGVLAVIVRWQRAPTERPLGPEHIGAAMRVGIAYARHAPRLRALLTRAALFAIFAGALWAVLPVLVRDELGLGSDGYGALLGGVGVGAMLGAVLLARMSELASTDHLVLAATLAFAAACGVCALTTFVPAVAAAMLVAGAAWVTATSALNGTAIALLPGWVRSRGAAIYTLVFQGGQAVSAVLWGLVTQWAGVRTALAAVGAGLALTVGGVLRWRLPGPGDVDVEPRPWPVDAPHEHHHRSGPILVLVEFRVPPAHHAAFRERMRLLGHARRRTGAERWGLFQDSADPDRFVETFLVATWEEHLRQHGERSTAGDRALLEAALELAERGPLVQHLLYAYPEGR
jgi:MFS family permease